jgi:hypothetical protein
MNRLEESVFSFHLLEEENPQAKLKALTNRRNSLKSKFIRALKIGTYASLAAASGYIRIVEKLEQLIIKATGAAYYRSKAALIRNNPEAKKLVILIGKAKTNRLVKTFSGWSLSMRLHLARARLEMSKGKGDTRKIAFYEKEIALLKRRYDAINEKWGDSSVFNQQIAKLEAKLAQLRKK